MCANLPNQCLDFYVQIQLINGHTWWTSLNSKTCSQKRRWLWCAVDVSWTDQPHTLMSPSYTEHPEPPPFSFLDRPMGGWCCLWYLVVSQEALDDFKVVEVEKKKKFFEVSSWCGPGSPYSFLDNWRTEASACHVIFIHCLDYVYVCLVVSVRSSLFCVEVDLKLWISRKNSFHCAIHAIFMVYVCFLSPPTFNDFKVGS